MTTEPKCPFNQSLGGGASNRHWWPNQLRVDLLHQHSTKSDPMGTGFDYAEAFSSLTFDAATSPNAIAATLLAPATSARELRSSDMTRRML